MLGADALLAQPSPAEVLAARLAAGLTQGQAARLVSAAKGQPYRTWQGYETDESKSGYRAIPPAAWALFLLVTGQHPNLSLQPKGVALCTL